MFLPYQYFKMEGLHLKDFSKIDDYMCKIDLKNAYFAFGGNTVRENTSSIIGGGQLHEFTAWYRLPG